MAIEPEVREIQRAEHDSTANIQLKKVGKFGWDAFNTQWVKVAVDSNGDLAIQDNNQKSAFGSIAIMLF